MVISIIERNQALLIEEVEQKQEAVEKKGEELLKELRQEISELQKRRSELQHLESTEDPLHLIQVSMSICSACMEMPSIHIFIRLRLFIPKIHYTKCI